VQAWSSATTASGRCLFLPERFIDALSTRGQTSLLLAYATKSFPHDPMPTGTRVHPSLAHQLR
jgi:hypothetical protein